jgi:hypothetical protein
MSESKPGMCFGFSLSESIDKKKYELEIFGEDKWPSLRKFMPDSQLHEMSRYALMPDTQSFFQVTSNGFHMIENWTANIILQLKTNNPSAKIVSLLSP